MTDTVTLLIIDNDSKDRQTYKRFLTKEGRGNYRFLETDTGALSLSVIANESADCILLDYNLPDINGIDLLEALGKTTGNQVPVILLTGIDNEEVAVQAMKSGASDYLVKEDLGASLLSRTVHYAIERKNAAKRIQDHAALLATLMNTIPNPVFNLTRNQQFAGCNHAFEEFTGYSADDTTGKSIFEVFPEDVANRLADVNHQLMSASEPKIVEASLENVHGQTKEVLFYVASYCDAYDQVQGFVATMLDITRQKQMEWELKKNVEQLEKANQRIIEQQKAVIEEERLKVLLQMAGATAHELNQPLMSLLGNIELMALSLDDPQQVNERISLIEESSQRIASIVKRFQDIRHTPSIKPSIDNSVEKIDTHLNVLVVEDNKKDFQNLRKTLEACGNMTIRRAADLKKGFQIIKQFQIDLILLDFMLSTNTGLEFLAGLSERAIEIPVVVITGQGDEMVASKVIQAGAYDYLPKAKLGVRPLTRIIHNTLEKHKLKREVSKAIQKMAEMSTRDELTGLFNRRYFKDSLSLEIARADRYGNSFAVFMADLDHFKQINDTLGHAAGDYILSQTARLLPDCLRESDIACRYGGEEFAALLPNTGLEDCRNICERFRKTLANHVFEWEDQTLNITVSIGITIFSASGEDTVDSLMRRSDEAMYLAKNNGRNCIAAVQP